VYILYFADLESLPSGRLSNLLNAVVSLFLKDFDIIYFLFKAEPSGSTRVILNYLALSVPFSISSLGLGLGGFQMYWIDIATTMGVPIFDHEVLDHITRPVSQTYFTHLASSLGIFSFIYFGIVFSKNTKVKNECSLTKRIYFFSLSIILIFTFFQLQITNPILWVIIATLKQSRNLITAKQELFCLILEKRKF
jgi:hypothetical protein